MQHCTVCGSELPDDARFCGKCGHVLSNIDTIDNESAKTPGETIDTPDTTDTANTLDSPAENALPQDDLTAIDTQALAQHENNVLPQDDLAAIDTQALTQHESNGHEPIVALSMPPAVGASLAVALPADEQSLQPQQAPVPKARRGLAARWIIIALIVVLVVAGSAAALVSLLRPQLPGLGNTSAVVTSPTSITNTNVTPVATACPQGSTSSTCTSTTPTTPATPGLTPTVKGTSTSTPSIVNMTFSGAVKGNMTVSNVARCGPSSSGSEYDLYLNGTIGGTQYTFVSRITPYTGPATYNTGHIFVVFSQQPLSASTVWGNSGNLPARAIVNSDTKSGTMEIDLSGAVNTVHVSGSWSCA